MARYLVAALALDDLAGIRQYIAQTNPPAAERMMAAFFERFALIASQPEIGAVYVHHCSTRLRVHSVGQYAIFYRVVGSDIEIARVLHGARDLDWLVS